MITKSSLDEQIKGVYNGATGKVYMPSKQNFRLVDLEPNRYFAYGILIFI